MQPCETNNEAGRKIGEHLSAIESRINRRPGKLPKVSDNAIDWEHYIENLIRRTAMPFWMSALTSVMTMKLNCLHGCGKPSARTMITVH